MENKRRSARIDDSLIISICKEKALLRIGARIKNISDTGISLRLTQFFSADSILELNISSETHKIKIYTLARVIWISKTNAPKYSFEAGFEFQNISPADQVQLRQYLRRKASETQAEVIWRN